MLFRSDILDDVKTVNIGNEMSVTLSIGIGSGGDSFSLRNDFARNAMDMALERSGDQAVVKDSESIRYFGGKSKSVEKSTRVKARVKAHALRGIMETMDNVIIMGHKNMDIDCFGSAIGIGLDPPGDLWLSAAWIHAGDDLPHIGADGVEEPSIDYEIGRASCRERV